MPGRTVQQGREGTLLHCLLQGAGEAALTLSKLDLVLANPDGRAFHTLQRMLCEDRTALIHLARGRPQ